MESLSTVDLARIQFAVTAAYHFLFVPLTIGLTLLLAIMETIYVKTGDKIWKDMVKFWGVLFGINFAMGVATGITMEFQFGTNWSYYSHYVGDIFGAPLAIEGMMAFFLESTFVGLFFFGWGRLSAKKHLMVTWLVFFGTNFSALWILIANGWMQHPVGSYFNYETLRMEVSNFSDILFNPLAQSRFAHTLYAAYSLGAVFIISISCAYLIKGRNTDFAKRSIYVASMVGFIASILLVFLGDDQGRYVNEYQKTKMAAIEAIWKTEEAPAAFTVLALPDVKRMENKYAIRIPAVLGIIATRSTTEKVKGFDDLLKENKQKIRNGMIAYGAVMRLRSNPNDSMAKASFEQYKDHLGYGLLLKKYKPNVVDATEKDISMAAMDTIPPVKTVFFLFRLMVGIGFFLVIFFGAMLWLSYKDKIVSNKKMLILAVLVLPLPWIATTSGWMVAEIGRQPWTVFGVLPTELSSSHLPVSHVWGSLFGFFILYTSLLVVDLYLMIKYAKIGPDGKKNMSKKL